MTNKEKYKKTTNEVVEEPKTDETKKTEAIEVLKTQIKHHNTMMVKAQGALEVLLELTKTEES